MQFGPAIPHNPHGYTAKDGTHYPAVFPYESDTPISVKLRGDDDFDSDVGDASGLWWGSEPSHATQITAYRLPADHHAYGAKVSSMGREPDRWVNDYQIGGQGDVWESRARCDRLNLGRIGIWRIYLKDKAA
jgi:hypothetical protein